MRQSLRTRLVIVFSGMIVFTILLIWCMNRFLLPVYYQYSKVNQMTNVYEKTKKQLQDVNWDILTDDQQYELLDSIESISANGGVNICVIRFLYDGVSGWQPTYIYPAMTQRQMDETRDRFKRYIYSKYTGETLSGDFHLIFSNGDYDVYKVYDEKMQSNYIEMANTVSEGTWIYMRSSFQRVQESTNISNQLLAYVGLFVILLGMIIIFFVSKWYTKPILRLAKNAEKLGELKFDIHCDDKRADEIGVLGHSMNKLSGKLEETISELKTANNELLLDIERKEKQEEMRSEFLGNVSHELKTPIALIQGYAEGLQDNVNEDEESRQFYCDVIIDEAQKMDKMVRNLLSLNQLEFGNGKIHIDRFNLSELIHSAVDKIDLLAKQESVKIAVVCEDDIYAWADEYMIDEVVTNYLSNAMNHVEGPKKIEVKVTSQKDKVKVSVFNTGKPIPSEDIDRIWEKFYKVDKARTREYGGNGIGLSIVRAIMDAHNQEYGAKNYDNGVEFWFCLDEKNAD